MVCDTPMVGSSPLDRAVGSPAPEVLLDGGRLLTEGCTGAAPRGWIRRLEDLHNANMANRTAAKEAL